MNVQLVGSFGVAAMPLVGGPFDGEIRVACVGAPAVMLYAAKEESTQQTGDALYSPLFTTSAIARMLGTVSADSDDEWKQAAQKAEAARRKPRKRFALYAPKLVENRYTLALFFVGVTEIELPA